MTGSNILDTLNSKSISGGMNTTYARFRLQDIPIILMIKIFIL